MVAVGEPPIPLHAHASVAPLKPRRRPPTPEILPALHAHASVAPLKHAAGAGGLRRCCSLHAHASVAPLKREHAQSRNDWNALSTLTRAWPR